MVEFEDNAMKKLRKSYEKCVGTCRYACRGKGHELVCGQSTGTGIGKGTGTGIGKCTGTGIGAGTGKG